MQRGHRDDNQTDERAAEDRGDPGAERDELGQELAQDAVRMMTGDDDPAMERDDDASSDEVGGPFEITDAAEELGYDQKVTGSWTREPEPLPHGRS
jgi:hypothetical protein